MLSYSRRVSPTLQVSFRHSLVLSTLLLLGGIFSSAQAQIAIVQRNSATPIPNATTVTIPYTSAQGPGNLNVVVAGWNDSTATISSVTDSRGNQYSIAAAPVVQAGTASQAIYYAKNIIGAAAGANTVTITFSAAANFPDIRIAEYSGLDPVNPLDVSAGAQGNSATSDSGPVTTTNPNDLLIGANTVQASTVGAGAGFISRLITPDGDILEDRIVTVAGSNNATAILDRTQLWVMQIVAFRVASGSVSAPSIISLNPSAGPVGTPVTITGTNFGPSQGSSIVRFGSIAAVPTAWSSTSITARVPSSATTGSVIVNVGGLASNGVNFTVGTGSSISFVQMNSATPQAAQSPVTVPYLNSQTAGDLNVVVVGWNDTAATITSVTDTLGNAYTLAVGPTVQTGTATQAIYYAKNIASAPPGANTVTATFTPPAFHPDIRIAEYSGIDPLNAFDAGVGAQGNTATSDSGPVNTTNGNDLLVGANTVQSISTGAGAGYISRAITPDGDILEDQIVSVPGSFNATTILDKIQPWIMQVAAFRAATGGGSTVPNIASLNPTSGPVGTSVTITGTNFGTSQGTSTVTFNGTIAAPATNWTATSITLVVQANATTGNVIVTVNNVASNGVNFTVTAPPPSITSLNPTTGPVGTSVTITGTNFGTSQRASTVTFNGTVAAPASNWSTTSITVQVPTNATSGNVLVTVNSVASNGMNFSVPVLPPSISSLNPVVGIVGTPVTISGSNFGATQGTSTVTFNNTTAVPTSWSATSISLPVPVNASTGNVVVTVAGQPSNAINFTVQSSVGPIALVQHRNRDSGTSSSATLAFSSNNTAGNWIAVVIRAGKSGQLFTVTDSRGNTYRKAIQFNETVDGTTLGLFYAENIAAGANTVTVADTIVGTLRFAIFEYSGVATSNSLDVAAFSQGTSTSPNSGNGTTTASSDLLLAEISSANPANFTAGSGYSVRDLVPAEPNTKLLVEDQIQPSAGPVSAGASLGASDNWGAAFAAFKSAAGSGGLAPSIGSLNPTSGVVGSLVTISGANFGASQGTSKVTFNGIATTPSNWSATAIMAPVPTGATTGNVIVTVGGAASNAVTFTVITPASIANLVPNSGAFGTPVTISGSNFGANQGTSTVTFNGVSATPTSWSLTSITAPVPNGATTGNVVVTVSGVPSNGLAFTVTTAGPSLSTLSMSQGPVGAIVTITGLNFGMSQGASAVTFNNTGAFPTNWTATSIDVPVPAGATTGNVVVTVGGVASNGLHFTVTPPPSITSLNPTAGPVGMVVTINGANFGPTVGTRTSSVSFNGTVARPDTWSDTRISVPVPAGATSGNVIVSISGITSNAINFIVAPAPSISSLSPSTGLVGTSITIAGANFGPTQGASAVSFNGVTATPTSWSDASIVVPVPSGATTGNVTVNVNGQTSSGVNFTVTPSGGVPITLIQHNSTDAGTSTSSALAFSSLNTAGNWIGVCIRAGQTGQLFTVTDSRGNTYRKATQFNETLDGTTVGVFYAENIAGGANTVRVSDNITGTLRFAILEYSGVAFANSFDAFAATQGASNSPNSGNVATGLNGDLLLAIISTANAETFAAGNGYTARERVPAAPGSKLMVEDQIQASAGTISANASIGASDNWSAILAAFKSASAGPPPPISVSVSPTTANVGTGSGTQVFTAQLVNDIQSKGVAWSLSGTGCSGSTCGALSQITTTSVTYTGPPNAPNPASVTLTATSVADNSRNGTATITVIQGLLSVTLTPKRGSVTSSQTQQFTATVFNDPSNAGVTWQVDGNTGGNIAAGTINAAGLFTPGTQPGLHTITATSIANTSVNASVSFAVTDLSGVFMHHNDRARTGQNLKEYLLTPANVNSSNFSRLFSCPVDGYVYAEPLYVPNLTFGSTSHNVVFIATEHDSVYAFDADSPSCLQLWKVSFLANGVTTMPWQDTAVGSGSNPTDDVFPEIGITSTPVIDPSTNTIYLVAKTKETVGSGCSLGSPCYISRLHALDLLTGAEKLNGPATISAPNFVSLRHFNRPALLLANNTIYVGFGSHGDIANWYGWLFGYDAATLARKFVFSTSDPTGSSNGASLWGGGAGPATDAGGNLFVTTGNGNYDGTKNFSESALKVSSAGSLLDWFTPFNRGILDVNDVDLGSAGIMILPDTVGSVAHPHLLIATGKIAVLYLLDQTNMGRFNSGGNLDVQEVIPVPPPNTTQLDGGIYGIPAYWNGNIYVTGQNFPLSQFKISNGNITTPQFATSSNLFPSRGATPAVSASDTTNGIVWVLDLSGWTSGGNAILDAYDATNVSNLLFSSPASGSGAAGPAVKFTVPTVANGKVYVGGQSTFTVFGLLPN